MSNTYLHPFTQLELYYTNLNITRIVVLYFDIKTSFFSFCLFVATGVKLVLASLQANISFKNSLKTCSKGQDR